MPTEKAAGPAIALFLFAHQDDEFGVFHELEECCALGQRVLCVYLTRGAAPVAAQRNGESVAVLLSLGVLPDDIIFAGDLLAIDDGALAGHLAVAAGWLRAWLAGSSNVDKIYVTAWEGGHHDHDALHALTVVCADGVGMLDRVCQYALYNGAGLRGPWFRVLAPLPENGPVRSRAIGWSSRWRYLRLCLSYPSQRGTWVGLFPFVLLHYLRKGRQTLQPVSMARIDQRPHDGALYYERRFNVSWPSMDAQVRAWRHGRQANARA